MTPEEYKAKKELLDDMIKDTRIDIKNLKNTSETILDKAFNQKMIKRLQIWKDIIKEDK